MYQLVPSLDFCHTATATYDLTARAAHHLLKKLNMLKPAWTKAIAKARPASTVASSDEELNRSPFSCTLRVSILFCKLEYSFDLIVITWFRLWFSSAICAYSSLTSGAVLELGVFCVGFGYILVRVDVAAEVVILAFVLSAVVELAPGLAPGR